MSFEALGAAALNYAPCRYGNSRVLFRGPQRRLDTPYVAFVGGTETYGKFIKTPFPALVESKIGVNCVNFGIPNAGLDVFVNDDFITDAASGAEVTVLQVVGAQNLSNRFYTVHPRRNDRFLAASPILSVLFPEVDFAEVHFTGQLLSMLYAVSGERFSIVRRELQIAWSARMKLLMRRIDGDVMLLWFADHAPLGEEAMSLDPARAQEPLFVTRNMLDDLAAHISGYVEVIASSEALEAVTEGMVFTEMEALAASKLMNPRAHGEAARKLGDALESRK